MKSRLSVPLLPPEHPTQTPVSTQGAAAAPGLFGLERKWWVLVAIGAGTFMSALDTSVVNTILPVLNRAFGSQVATVEWVVIVYLLLVSGLLPSLGRLGDLRGHKPVYVGGFFIFLVSSALCGLAPGVGALVFFRAVQAVGAAMLSANSPAILTKNFPAAQRGRALGLQATMTYLGLVAGPSLGGWLTEAFSWRAVFYINIPVCLLALALSLRVIPRDAPAGTAERFDLPGAALFMAGLVSLLLGLNRGHEWGWSSPAILGLLAGAGLLLAAFVVVERRSPYPMLDLSLFRRRTFSASTVSAVINYICVYSVMFLMPFYLLQGRGLNPAQAGLLLTAQPIVMAVVAPISGALSDRIGARLPGAVGMAILAAGLFTLSGLGPQTPFGWVVAGLAVCGLGIGIFISPNNSALLGSAPLHRRGIASGILATARNVGMVLGIGLSGAIFTTVMARAGQDLFHAARLSFLAAMTVALAGIISSAVRGNGET